MAKFLITAWTTSGKRRAFTAAVRAIRNGLPGTAMDVAALSTRGYQLHADLVLAHFGQVGVSASYLQKAGLVRGRLATIFHGYDITISEVLSKYRSHYIKLFRDGECFLPVSRFFADRLQKWGVDPTRVHVCRMGIDAQRFEFRPRERTTDGLKLLAVARLTEKKGLEYLIRAMALLPDCVTLNVIGTGTLERSLNFLADELELYGRVQFVGARTHEEVRDFLQDADVFVLPSVTADDGDMEGVPVALMEAMATGVAVVSTFHSGIPELIEDGITGFLVPERNPILLASAICRIESGEVDVQSIRIKARQSVEEHFNVETEATRLFRRMGLV